MLLLVLWGLAIFTVFKILDNPKGDVAGLSDKSGGDSDSVQNIAESGEASKSVDLNKQFSSPDSLPKPPQKPAVSSPDKNAEERREGDKNIESAVQEQTGPQKVYAPIYMSKYSGEKLENISKGSIGFRVKAEWGEHEDRALVFFNYNGEDTKNLFWITGSGRVLTFDTYDNLGQGGMDDANGDLTLDFFGKTYDVLLVWDFGVSPPVKQTYINGVLQKETNPESRPSGLNEHILINSKLVSDVVISDK